MFWSVGVYNDSRVDPACYLDVEVVNNTAETVTPLSDGNWFCESHALLLVFAVSSCVN